MKIKKTSIYSKNKKAAIGLSAVLVCVLAFGTFFYFNRDSSRQTDGGTKNDLNSIDYGPPTVEQQQAGDSTGSSEKEGSDPPPNPNPQGNGKSQVNVTVTSWSQDNQYFRISFDISAVDNTGTCALTLTKNGIYVRKEVGVQALPSSSTCKGFSVPLSELSTGQWDVTLVYENGSLTGTAKQVVKVE